MKVQTSVSKKIIQLLCVSLASVFLLQCKKGKEENVDFSVIPSQPPVITAKTVDDSGDDVTPPWFKIDNISVNNKTENQLTLVGLKFEITTLADDGSALETTVDISAADYEATVVVGRATCIANFTAFDPIPAGKAANLTLTDPEPEGSLPATEDDAAVICPPMTGTAGLYVSGPDRSINFSWKVNMKPLGWFDLSDTEQERFEKTVTFRTR